MKNFAMTSIVLGIGLLIAGVLMAPADRLNADVGGIDLFPSCLSVCSDCGASHKIGTERKCGECIGGILNEGDCDTTGDDCSSCTGDCGSALVFDDDKGENVYVCFCET